MNSYTFKCIRVGGPGPAVHLDSCSDDDDAAKRALSLFEIWPLAVKVHVSRREHEFEVAKPVDPTVTAAMVTP